jgi:p-hydroxybenzoate 3-monooxygenase
MTDTVETTAVVIIGAGVSGLTLGNFLLRNGVECIILEKHTREYVEARQRAGTIDSFGVRMLTEWGFAEVIEDPTPELEGGFWIDGFEMPIEFDEDDNDDSVSCPQQILVRNLTNVFLRDGGDLRYEAKEIFLDELDSERPWVSFVDSAETRRVLATDFVAGCDGDRGISRASIPTGILTRHAHEYAYSWLSIRAEVGANFSGMAIHERGFASMIPRGAAASRLYLQVSAGDSVEAWPAERIWTEMAARFGKVLPEGPITETSIVPLRSVVYDPMSYGRLYLLGDAAHIVPPMSAKGIHLALHDAEVFARAIISRIKDNDSALLKSYSHDALEHIWNYQAFASWITDLMHNAGDASYEGDFRKEVARAELQRQFASPTANRLFSELTAGLN